MYRLLALAIKRPIFIQMYAYNDKKGGLVMRTIFRRANSVDARPLRQLFRKAHRQNAILGYVFPAYRMPTEKIRRLIRRDDYYLVKNSRMIIGAVANWIIGCSSWLQEARIWIKASSNC